MKFILVRLCEHLRRISVIARSPSDHSIRAGNLLLDRFDLPAFLAGSCLCRSGYAQAGSR
jgi:hypothetical protein